MQIITQHKTRNLKVVVFKLPIYDSKICFIKHDGVKGYNQSLIFLEKLGINTDEYKEDSWRHCYGFAFSERVKLGMVQFLIINTRKDYMSDYVNTLSHEITHLVDHIARHHGLTRQKQGSNEHIAYLTGYLTDFLFKV